jgi:hypothetical protein
MIILQLKAGLGNQMFQYAFGKALAIQNNDVLKMDLIECIRTDNPLWKYRLGVFVLEQNFASPEEAGLLQFPRGELSRFYFKLRTKLGLFNIGFVPRFTKKKGNVYLNGFWQTEKYFKDFPDQIRAEFALKDPIGNHASLFMDSIKKSSGTVSLHIRRTDYANNTAINNMYGTFTIQYYIDALKYISSKVNGPLHIFFFSDDIEWVKNNLKVPYEATYVYSPDIKDHEELVLMSACDHNIICNSTFSWWGAWMNRNPDKIVVAPKIWARTKRNRDYKDIVPSSWIRL